MTSKEQAYADHFRRNRESILAATVNDARKIADMTREAVVVVEVEDSFVVLKASDAPADANVVATVKPE